MLQACAVSGASPPQAEPPTEQITRRVWGPHPLPQGDHSETCQSQATVPRHSSTAGGALPGQGITAPPEQRTSRARVPAMQLLLLLHAPHSAASHVQPTLSWQCCQIGGPGPSQPCAPPPLTHEVLRRCIPSPHRVSHTVHSVTFHPQPSVLLQSLLVSGGCPAQSVSWAPMQCTLRVCTPSPQMAEHADHPDICQEHPPVSVQDCSVAKRVLASQSTSSPLLQLT
mmetsp:Transcript_97581/g.198214  ORF Transcript_97581/g.198214 Transcript_97581/m.198214 type:complete len:226 (+) Transcript_97581:1761-2438(+)